MDEIHARVSVSWVTWCGRYIIAENLEVAQDFKVITCEECQTQILRNI